MPNRQPNYQDWKILTCRPKRTGYVNAAEEVNRIMKKETILLTEIIRDLS